MKEKITMNLQELRKIAEAATSEGWIYQIEHFSQMGYEKSYWQAIGPRRFQTPRHGEAFDQAIADAKFSETFSPRTVLSLIARLEAAEDVLRYFAQLDGIPVTKIEIDGVEFDKSDDMRRAREYFAKHEGANERAKRKSRWE